MNYTSIYNSLIESAKTRTLNEYTESHHIVPKCMGGTDDASNLVDLTPKEHYIAHHLLTKMYPNEASLKVAFAMMCYTRDVYVPPRVYESARQAHSDWMSSRTVTEETRRKMSESAKARCTPEWRARHSKAVSNSVSGEKNPFYGKTHSEESKRKMSDAKVGTQAGEDNPFYGKTHTEESLRKMSEAQRGKKLSQSHIDKMSEAMKTLMWFNNGTVNKRCKECPEGFVPGRLPFTRKKKNEA
jgi:hypothetical protein